MSSLELFPFPFVIFEGLFNLLSITTTIGSPIPIENTLVLSLCKDTDIRPVYPGFNGELEWLIPRIENMSIDEYIYSRTRYETRTDSSGKEYEVEITNFYYDADYFLTLSYSIVDVRTERIIASRKFVVDDSDNFRITSPSFISSYPERSFRRMIDSTMSRITRQLVPLQTTAEITLMDNKPKDKNVEAAYDALKDGNLNLSSSLFLENYKVDKHIPSGYNAALVTAAMGDIEVMRRASGRLKEVEIPL